MQPRLKRVVFYSVLSPICVSVAIIFTESRTAFVTVFSIGLLIALAADLLFWHHLYRVFSDRR